jgi:hypothetical protein
MEPPPISALVIADSSATTKKSQMDHDDADAQQMNHYWRLESAKANQGLKSHQQWQHMILQNMGSNCSRNKERKNYRFPEPGLQFLSALCSSTVLLNFNR